MKRETERGGKHTYAYAPPKGPLLGLVNLQRFSSGRSLCFVMAVGSSSDGSSGQVVTKVAANWP